MNEPKSIHIKGARVHNLRNIEVEIPHDTLTVITGLSGSGKSTLAFDTIFAEGQRRYVESLSAPKRATTAERSFSAAPRKNFPPAGKASRPTTWPDGGGSNRPRRRAGGAIRSSSRGRGRTTCKTSTCAFRWEP